MHRVDLCVRMRSLLFVPADEITLQHFTALQSQVLQCVPKRCLKGTYVRYSALRIARGLHTRGDARRLQVVWQNVSPCRHACRFRYRRRHTHIRSQCTYRHACSMLVRIFVHRVGVINSRRLRMLMQVVLASTSTIYLNVAGMYLYTFAMLVQTCMLHVRSNVCIPGGCHY